MVWRVSESERGVWIPEMRGGELSIAPALGVALAASIDLALEPASLLLQEAEAFVHRALYGLRRACQRGLLASVQLPAQIGL
jgi:hypothetical protein